MSDRLDAMSLLVTCIDCGSLSAGARHVGMPLATVSRKVAELEERIGARLLLRSARGLTLTDAGSAYVAVCRRILEDVSEAERLAAGEFSVPRGVLNLAAPIVFGRMHLLPVISDFLKAYPQVDVRLSQADRPVSLQEEHIDAAVRIGHLPESSLRARRVGHVRWVCCASTGYLNSRDAPQKAEDLSRHDCISFSGLMASDKWRFGEGASERLVPVHSRMIVNTADAAIEAAAAGLGVARVLSYQVTNAVAEGRLEIILKGEDTALLPVNILFAAGLMPQKTRAFVDFAAPHLETALHRATF